jgi:magnesium-transporting ATPase (P-type)
MEETSRENHRTRNILIGIALAAGTFLAGILFRRWRSRRYAGTSPPVERKLLQKISGLSEAEAKSRKQEDLDNTLHFKPTRSRREIWRENVVSIFNLSLVGLALVQLLFDKPLDALLSLGVLGLNIGLNVFQEYFARMRIKDILLETRPHVTVIREQTTRSIDANDIVVGDMVAFGPGDELLADGVIVHQAGLVVDESMLGDGNRRATKGEGDQVFAGTFCVSGRAVYTVEKVGRERYITSLIQGSEETKERLTPIEKIINQVLRVLLAVVAFFTIFLIYNYLNITLPISVDFFNEVAGIIFSLAPAGLFFMIIVTYAASTADIAKVGALVHRARSVETMAQVNTICLSREGVLTGMRVDLKIFPQSEKQENYTEGRIQQMLGDYVRSSVLDNQITRAIGTIYEGSPRKALDEAPYLSVAGWNAITFDDPDLSGVYVLGVPAALEPYLSKGIISEGKHTDGEPGQVRKIFSRLGGVFRRSDKDQDQNDDQPNQDKEPEPTQDQGSQSIDSEVSQEEEPSKPGLFRRLINRVSQMAQSDGDQIKEADSQGITSDPPIELIFAYYPDPSPIIDEKGRPQFPIPLIPLCQLTFVEQVRPEAVPLIRKYTEEGINVKIFAAERADQSIALLEKVGLKDLSLNLITGSDLFGLDEGDFSQASSDNAIFLQLSPEQMANVISDLRAKGQYVAMVGDSVNDVPAMVQANLAITHQTSSQAAQSVADILLLENSLSVLERVLEKGQRIVNGLLDILKLYLTQALYLALLISAIQIIGFGFPIRGIQLTVITMVSITIPALGFTLWANPGVLYGKSLRKSLSHFVIPAAVTIAIAGTFAFFYFRFTSSDRDYTHLAVTYVLSFTGLLAVLFLRPPFRILAGGAPVSKDRRIFLMVIVLAVLFFLTVALTAAIPFLQDLLMLDWLDPLTDYLIVSAIVIVWAILLLLTWRIWRLESIWVGDEVKEADGSSTGLSETDEHIVQTSQQEKSPPIKDTLDEKVLVQDSSPTDSISSQD